MSTFEEDFVVASMKDLAARATKEITDLRAQLLVAVSSHAEALAELSLATQAVKDAETNSRLDRAIAEKAEAATAAMRKALEWYADEDKYRAVRRLTYIPAEAEEDCGRRAKRALTKDVGASLLERLRLLEEVVKALRTLALIPGGKIHTALAAFDAFDAFDAGKNDG